MQKSSLLVKFVWKGLFVSPKEQIALRQQRLPHSQSVVTEAWDGGYRRSSRYR